MHDVFGMEVLNLFDLQNGDFYLGTADDKADESASKKSSDEETADLSNVNLEEVDLDAVSKEEKQQENPEDEASDKSE